MMLSGVAMSPLAVDKKVAAAATGRIGRQHRLIQQQDIGVDGDVSRVQVAVENRGADLALHDERSPDAVISILPPPPLWDCVDTTE